jgi:hypothetical protein
LNLAHGVFKMGSVCTAGFSQPASGVRQTSERSGK